MCETATILRIRADFQYHLAGGWKSYADQANEDGEKIHVTLEDTAVESTRAVTFVKKKEITSSRKLRSMTTVSGVICGTIDKKQWAIRITRLSSKGNDCIAVVTPLK